MLSACKMSEQLLLIRVAINLQKLYDDKNYLVVLGREATSG